MHTASDIRCPSELRTSETRVLLQNGAIGIILVDAGEDLVNPQHSGHKATYSNVYGAAKDVVRKEAGV